MRTPDPLPAPAGPPASDGLIQPSDAPICRRFGEWLRPPTSPPARRYAETSEALLARLGEPPDDVVDAMLDEALSAYTEVANLVDSAERRAATIQGAIAIAASLTLAGGSLLLTKNLASDAWTVTLAIGFGATVIAFAIAAWRSVLVSWPRFMWASPAVTDIADDHAKISTARDVKIKRVRDLLIAYGRRDSVAQAKIRLLGSAFRWLLLALTLIAVLAALFAARAISEASSVSTHTTKVRTTTPTTGTAARSTQLPAGTG